MYVYIFVFILYFFIQFFIIIGDNLDYFDGVYIVFGEVIEGMDIIKKINEIFVDKDFVLYQDIRYGFNLLFECIRIF